MLSTHHRTTLLFQRIVFDPLDRVRKVEFYTLKAMM
jgi:hypothetical protein